MKNIVIVNGYARSGKSTFMNAARTAGKPAISTSDILSEVCDTMLDKVFGIDYDTKNKEDRIHCSFITRNGSQSERSLDSRKFKISMAEEVLRPILGEDVLVNTSAKKVNEVLESHDTVYVEIINKREVDLFIKALPSLKNIDLHVVTIRSDREKSDVDTRELLNGYFAYAMSDEVINNDYTDTYFDMIGDYLNSH